MVIVEPLNQFNWWWWWCYLTHIEGCEFEEILRRPNSWATPQGPDQWSKMEEAVPKKVHQRGLMQDNPEEVSRT